MNKFGTIIKVVGIVALVIVVGGVIGWLGSGGSKPPVLPPDPVSVPAANPAPAPNPGLSPAPAPPTPAPVAPRPAPVVAPVHVSPDNLITNWADQVDEILSAEGEESLKARQMLEMFPRLPEDGQVEVAQHLSNLTADQDYAPLGGYMTNAALPEAVLDVLLADTLNRPNSIKMPLLLEVARNEQHPKAPEARDLLELFLEEDFGKDWGKWQTRLQQWLQDNPD